MVLVLGMGVGRAGAATYWVATGGSDADSGNAWTKPWATLQHAVDTIAPGDTILVQAGTYAGCVMRQVREREGAVHPEGGEGRDRSH